MNKWEACKGCSMFVTGANTCRDLCTPEHKDKKCPCQTCVIKMVCNTACSSYNTYQERFLEFKTSGIL